MSSVPVPHILVVDDDSAMRQLVAEYLGHNDFRVTGAASGTEPHGDAARSAWWIWCCSICGCAVRTA